MKVLLLNPESRKYIFPKPYEFPLGLLYIAAILKKNSYEVDLLDFNLYNQKRAHKLIKKENPDVVGIACFSGNRKKAFDLVKIVKEINQDIKVVMGGPHVHSLYEQVLKNYPVDVVVRGEGEMTFLELMKCFKNNKQIKKVDGIAFKKGNKIIKTKERVPIQNLDSLPFPAYELLLGKKYDKRINITSVQMISKRGCPYHCEFCQNINRNVRLRDSKKVVDEMEMVLDIFKPKLFRGNPYTIFFDDPVFNLSHKHTIQLCKEIIKRKLDVSWRVEDRVDLVSRDVLRFMKKAGCVIVGYGVESGSQKILDNVRKGITIAQIKRAFKLTHEIGIKTAAFIMVGNPGENKKTVRETEKLINLIRPSILVTAITTLFPGTGLYERAKAEGLITDEYWLSNKPFKIYTGNLSTMEAFFYKWKLETNHAKQINSWLQFSKGLIYRTLRDLKINLENRSLF